LGAAPGRALSNFNLLLLLLILWRRLLRLTWHRHSRPAWVRHRLPVSLLLLHLQLSLLHFL
jgi:hypothetical protein